MRKYLTLPILALTLSAFSACDVRVKSDAPPTTVEKKETTIVNPAPEKKVENNTTIVNPPAEKK